MTQQQPDKQNILVTGASGGLGTALVHRLDELSYRVFAGVRREEDGQTLTRSADNVVPVILDITDEESIAAAAETVEQAAGDNGLHGLVNNAGIIVQGPLELVSIDSLRRQFEVNVVGQMAVTQAFLPALRTAQGRVVNMGAATGRVAIPFFGAISASKAALASLTDTLRMELKPFGVDVGSCGILIGSVQIATTQLEWVRTLANHEPRRVARRSESPGAPSDVRAVRETGGGRRRD